MALQILNSRRIDRSSLDQRNKAKHALVLSQLKSPKRYMEVLASRISNVTLPPAAVQLIRTRGVILMWGQSLI